MLEPRYTEGDIVEYRMEILGEVRPPQVSTIDVGPYREGIWWEYAMTDGSLVRDHEITFLHGRISNISEVFNSGL